MELLVTVSIIGILAVLLMPALKGAFDRGKDGKCLSNLRQWGIALNCYLADSGGALPYEGAEENPTWAQTMSAANAEAWYNVLPPYVDQLALSAMNASQRNEFYRPMKARVLQCPRAMWIGNERTLSGPRFSYAFNSQIFSDGVSRFMVAQVTDSGGANVNSRLIGASTVPFLLDARASTKEPKALAGMNNDVGTAQAYTRRLSNRHGVAYAPKGLANVAFLDGSVRSYKMAEIMNGSARNITTSPIIWNPRAPDEE